MVANSKTRLENVTKLVWKQVSLSKIELKEALKGIMSLDVNKMKNVCTTNLFVDVSNLPIII